MAIDGLPKLFAQMQFPAEVQHLILQSQQPFSLLQIFINFQGVFLYSLASRSCCFLSQGIGRVKYFAETWGSQGSSLLCLPHGVSWNSGLLRAISTYSTQLGAACQGSGCLQVMENSKIVLVSSLLS